MLIVRVELQNVKSYRDQIVEFAAGTNAIYGENGAGKSTLLEAIGFALFNHPPSRQSDFVRQGQQSGCVTVHFVSGKDARTYQVARRFGNSAEYFVYDPELKLKIASGRKDVLDWLKEHLGLEGTADPAVLFRDAIGVPQGLLTSAFLQAPSERKPTFDRLLQVDDFEKVYQELRETRNYLKDRLARVQARIAALEERVRRLPELQQQLDALVSKISEVEKRLEEIGIRLEHVTARRDELEDLKQQLDDLELKIEKLEIQLKKVREQLKDAEEELQKSEEAARIVEECRADYEAYCKAKDELDRQEGMRKIRDQLLETERGLKNQIERNQDRAERLETELREAERATEEMERLQPLVVRQEQLERELHELHEGACELALAQRQLQKLRDSIQENWKRLKAVREGLEEARKTEGNLRQTEEELRRVRAAKSAAEQQQGVLQAEIERLKKQTTALETAESTICPMCEQPLSASRRDELLARNHAQLEKTCTEYQRLSQQVTEWSEQIQQCEERPAALRSQLRQLPNERERVEQIKQLVQLRAERAQSRQNVAKLEKVPMHLQALEDELKGLGDPRAEYQRLSGIAQKRTAIACELASVQQEIARLQEELDRVEKKLLPYADLDAVIARLLAEMATREPNYRRFLEHKSLADMLPERRDRAEHLRQELQNLEAQRRQAFEERDQVAGAFDANALEALRAEEERLKDERSRLEGELKMLTKQLKQVEDEIKEIEGAREELQRAQEELKQIERTDRVIEFMRNVIRSAGPRMVRVVAARVSAAATRIFREIMADPTLRLQWKEDYGIVLEVDGRERTFEQLSGGEQMAAALAVRLALLRELSEVDVAFFDEPTSNLDSTRRENLATQIAAIRHTGLSQLFIISHDDTFREVTDHVVHVRKERGESIVETL
ncbi:MAG: AAA family ATPase [Anaerolineae bacterium]|nr:AAA family ATPase [Anaerolineae bacterium]